jgi:hypothetical protein
MNPGRSNQLSISLVVALTLIAVTRAHAVNSVSGEAFGTFADVPIVATSPKNPDVVLPPDGGNTLATVLAQDVPGLFTAGAVTATSSGSVGVTSANSMSEASVADLNILSGLITAQALEAHCASTGNGTTATSSDAGTTLANLKIDGLPAINVTPMANTMLSPIPGLSVIVNEQMPGGNGTTTSSLTVNLLHVTLSFPFPAGEIIVASAHCDVDFTEPPFDCSCTPQNPVSGEAFGARAILANQLVGPEPHAVLSSQGGSAEAAAVTLNIPGALTTGTVDSSTSGTVGPLSASSMSRTVIQDLNLLAGLVTADVLDARCNSTGDGTTSTSDATGTTVLNLVVDGGAPINMTPAPNTTINVMGVGTVILNEQIPGGNGTNSSSLTVNLVHVILLNGTADIVVASAHCDVDFVPNPTCNPCDDGNPCNGQEICDPQQGCLPAPGTCTPNTVSGEGYGISSTVVGFPLVMRNPDVLLPRSGGMIEAHILMETIPGLVNDATLTTMSTGTVGGGSASATTRAAVEQLDLLGGLITADLIVTDASSTGNGTTATSGAAGSLFVNLVIDSLPAINGTPPPNTVIGVPGVAVVILNEQIPGGNGTTTSSLTVNMIHVILLGGQGGEVVVASAHSDVDFVTGRMCPCNPPPGALSGEAFGVEGTVDMLVIPRNPRALLSPEGGHAEAQAEGLSVPSLLTSGTVDSSTVGTTTPASASVVSKTVVEQLNVSNGLVTADVLEARCTSLADGTTAVSTDTGTTVANLVIDGLMPISVTPAPNTMFNPIPGLNVIVNEQIAGGNGSTTSSLTVNLLHVMLGAPLPVTADVVIASAHCDVNFPPPQQGCTVPPPNPCDDMNPCNGVEICDPLLGCIPGPPPPTLCPTTTSTTSTSTTAPSTTTTTCPPVAFLVRTRGKVGDGGEVTGSIGANDPGGSFRLGKNAFVSDGSTTVADTVKIGQGTSVFRVLANRLITGPDAQIRDGTGSPVLPLTDPFCPIPAFTCGAPDVTVPEHGLGGPLPPGSYGNLTIFPAGHLILDPGTFAFCSAKLGKDAVVITTGGTPTTINVAGRFRLQDGGLLGPTGGTPTPSLNVAGTSVRVGAANARLQAFLSAPNAGISIGRSGGVLGSFCAATSRTDKSITLTCPPP